MNNFKLRRFSLTIIILIMLTIFLAVPLVKVRFDTIYNIDYIVKNIEEIEIVGLNKENINEKTILTSRDDINLILNNLSNVKLKKTILYFETKLNSKSSDTSIHLFMEDGSVNTIKSNYMVWYNHSSSFTSFFRHPYAIGNCSIYEFGTDLHIEALLTN
jgi:hypothetical protein